MSSDSVHWESGLVEGAWDPMLRDLPEQYQLIQMIKLGGMGAIYKVRNRYTKQEFAIKVLLPKYAADADMRERFVQEASASSLLKHQGICQVSDFGVTQSMMPYLVMDWLDGITLRERVESYGPIQQGEAVSIFLDVAAALGYAHQKKVVHRDLKPDHVILCRVENQPKAVAKVVDFGIAKILEDENGSALKKSLTVIGTIIGTPGYMSPQQAKGEYLDGATDIYSLGCVMYFALTGKAPFGGATYMDVLYKQINDPPPPIDPSLKISDDLKAVISRALEKQVHDRYFTMEQLAADLKRISAGARVERIRPSIRKKEARQRILTLAYFVIGFVVTYFLSIFLQSWLDHDSVSEKARDEAASKQNRSAKTSAK